MLHARAMLFCCIFAPPKTGIKTTNDVSPEKKMKAIYTVLLLLVSNVFMTFAWYGQLKLREFKWFADWPLFAVIVFSWGIAFFEYCVMVPANRIGFVGAGGPFTLVQLKVIQEAISLIIFTIFSALMFKNEQLHWNHYLAFVLIVAAVFLVFKK